MDEMKPEDIEIARMNGVIDFLQDDMLHWKMSKNMRDYFHKVIGAYQVRIETIKETKKYRPTPESKPEMTAEEEEVIKIILDNLDFFEGSDCHNGVEKTAKAICSHLQLPKAVVLPMKGANDN